MKKAYFRLIRQYTPEKEPEKFKEIREAYEYLQEEANLASMQKVESIPTEFVKPYYQVLEWMKEEEYAQAAALCERVLSITELLDFRILLGKAYIGNDNSGKAVKLWEGLCAKQKDNLEYLEQLGDAYRARGWFNKALNVYYTLYKKNMESLSVYEKLLEIAFEQGAIEVCKEVSSRVLSYYRKLEKHTREDAEYMSDILYAISETTTNDPQWLLTKANEILDIMTEIPIEFELYESTLLQIYMNLLEILENDITLETVIERYQAIITNNVKNFSKENHYYLIFTQCHREEIKLKQDIHIHDLIKEVSNFWYGKMMHEANLEASPAELRMFQMEMKRKFADTQVYDTLLYIVDHLTELQPSLHLVQEEYPLLAKAMGEYFIEMINCDNQIYLFQKYEKKYKKLMGYPSGAILSLSTEDEEVYASDENGTYRREGNKVGRNDPCPCGSGRKYKQCCGK